MKTKTSLFFCLLLCLLWAGCQSAASPTPTTEPTPTSQATAVTPTAEPSPTIAAPTAEPTAVPTPLATGDYPWWNDTVFYEIFVRSFYDSDGDGIGDLNGLIEKLDYLNDGDPTTTTDLGITGIWLMPIMQSPSYHGYDVTDYYQVNERYGTNEDFQRLMQAAHQRGIRVIVDLVLNHTSVQHPWFQEAREDVNADKRDWYVWSAEDPGYRGPEGQKVWHSTPTGYYYALFWDGMPDLNLENPDVTAEMQNIARFWLEEMGADGFRLDAIKHLIENERLQENTRSTHEWLQGFYTFYKGVNPNALAVGEAWAATQQVLRYTGSEVDIAFQFDLAGAIINSLNGGINNQVSRVQQNVVDSFPPGQYATFLANHDQNRILTQLTGDENKAKLGATWLLTSPGVPFIYYGEEIGMIGQKPDEDIRRPMQWSGENIRAGFTSGPPWRAPAADYAERNVALQENDPNSLLNHYRSLVHLRNSHEALRTGEWTRVETGNPRLYAYLRHNDSQTILVLLNLIQEPVTQYGLELDAGPLTEAATPTLLLGEGTPAAPELNEAGGFNAYTPLPELPPQSSFIIQLTP